jgi:hypothetical protein
MCLFKAGFSHTNVQIPARKGKLQFSLKDPEIFFQVPYFLSVVHDAVLYLMICKLFNDL